MPFDYEMKVLVSANGVSSNGPQKEFAPEDEKLAFLFAGQLFDNWPYVRIDRVSRMVKTDE